MHNQEVDLLKEEIEMLSKQMRQQCNVIQELKSVLVKVTDRLQSHSNSVEMINSNLIFVEVQNVMDKANLCK